MSCTFACGVNAIDHNMVARDENVRVGAVVLAPGYQAYRAELSEEYGLGRYPNVVTSLQFERLLSASGPTSGHVQRPSDGKSAQKIAFLQCVGSRDQSHDYCSSVCCMYAAKQAIMAVEHAKAETHRQRAAALPGVLHGHARVQQRLRRILSPRREEIWRAVHALPHQRSARRPRHARSGSALLRRARPVAARAFRSRHAIDRHGDFAQGARVGSAPRHRTRRLRLLSHGAIQSARDEPRGHLRRRAVPRTEGHPRIDRGSERSRCGRRVALERSRVSR